MPLPWGLGNCQIEFPFSPSHFGKLGDGLLCGTEVWSLGCIMFELCTGSLPFMAATLQPSAWTRLHKRGPKPRAQISCSTKKLFCAKSAACSLAGGMT